MSHAAASSFGPRDPLPFEPTLEHPGPQEQPAIDAIGRSMTRILETTWADYGHSVRGVHAKSHGLLEGELRVLDDLPPALAQGIFAAPHRYPVVLRISTNPGDILDDTVSSPRGLALKVIGVSGDRLPGAEGAATQDFVMANSPVFVAPDARSFSRSLDLLAATTDTGQAWKKGLSSLLRGTASALASIGVEAGALKALGGHPLTHPLGETFYSQTPFRHGAHVAKLSVAPVSPELLALRNAPVALRGRPNGLRAAVIDFFQAHEAEWELRVQLRTNAATMPIEDASIPWPEAESPFVPVARITVPRQPAWSEARAAQVDDAMAFSPWHGIEAHRPLGSINRARRAAYPLSAGFRARQNSCPIHEPDGAPTLAQDEAAVFGRKPGREGRRAHTPDAMPNKIGQPLNATARTVTAGAVGGFLAGAVISGVMFGMEAATGTPSELVQLQRKVRRGAGSRRRAGARRRAGWGEQITAHGGHLALAALSGAGFAAAKPRGMSPVLAGSIFGAAFYALAYGVVGPSLRLTPKPTRDTRASVVQHGALHLAFGVLTALIAEQAAKRV